MPNSRQVPSRLSGVVVGNGVWDVIQSGSREFGPMGQSWTYSGHPVCAATALANLNTFEGESVVANAAEVGTCFHSELHAPFDALPLVGEVRGAGTLAALEFVKDRRQRLHFDTALKEASRVRVACLNMGLIARAIPHGDILSLVPPLVATRQDSDETARISKAAIDQVGVQVLYGAIPRAEWRAEHGEVLPAFALFGTTHTERCRRVALQRLLRSGPLRVKRDKTVERPCAVTQNLAATMHRRGPYWRLARPLFNTVQIPLADSNLGKPSHAKASCHPQSLPPCA